MKKTSWIALVAPAGIFLAFLCWVIYGAHTPSVPETQATVISPPATIKISLPVILSEKDRLLYQEIVRAQKKADWAAADKKMAELGDRLLVGEMLATRYLHHSYKASQAELAKWLEQYADHPQAYDIYMLAMAKSPALKSKLPSVSKAQMLQGYGDDNGLGSRPDEAFPQQTWRTAISQWRAGKKSEAAKIFTAIAERRTHYSAWQSSAACYWAWRSNDAIGQKKTADKFLRIAAEEPRSFYGILARKQLGESLDLDAQPVTLSESDILEMIGEPPIRRIIALGQSNLIDLAEKEIRKLFPASDEREKKRLLALAYHFNLASVQISMAKRLDDHDRTMDYAKYPIPHWQPQDGFKVEPALIYALMRQESGFRATATSSSGAQGLMQIMPKTASIMHRQMNSDLKDSGQPQLTGSVTDPGFNMALGQGYIQHLLENDLVDGNLFFMLTAYNAGPGRLQEWKRAIDYRNDPLLFVESIPFAQTRHYVMQVMTNYWIYSELAGSRNRSIYALLNGYWPSYDRGAFTFNAG